MSQTRVSRSILVIATLGIFLSAVITIAQTEAPKDGWFTASDGVRIHYLEQGKGVPVILIHGFASNAQSNWFGRGTAQAVAVNHRVIAIDARGHGQSDKPAEVAKYAGDRMYKDVLELMDELKIKKAHIGGYSMGSIYVARLMDMAPGRFITAFLGGGGFVEIDPALQARAAAKDGAPASDPATVLDALMARLATQPNGAPLIAIDKVLRPYLTKPLPIDLKKINFPVLAVNGEQDRPHAKTQRMERELKQFTNVVLPGKNHMAAAGDAGLRDALVAFVNAHDPK